MSPLGHLQVRQVICEVVYEATILSACSFGSPSGFLPSASPPGLLQICQAVCESNRLSVSPSGQL